VFFKATSLFLIVIACLCSEVPYAWAKPICAIDVPVNVSGLGSINQGSVYCALVEYPVGFSGELIFSGGELITRSFYRSPEFALLNGFYQGVSSIVFDDSLLDPRKRPQRINGYECYLSLYNGRAWLDHDFIVDWTPPLVNRERSLDVHGPISCSVD